MKRRMRFLILICTAMLLFFLNERVQAATIEEIIDLKQNTWTKTKTQLSQYNEESGEWDIIHYYYRIQVPSAGYVTVATKNCDTSLRTVYGYEADNRHSLCYIRPNETKKIAVDKGIYYLNTNDYFEKDLFYSFKAVNPTKNYCIGKAASLKAGSTVTVCMSKNHYYSRWYKIKLKKKKSITLWSDLGDQVYVYNARGKRIDKEHAGTKSTKYFTRKLKKGTYYIRIKPSSYEDYDAITLKWK